MQFRNPLKNPMEELFSNRKLLREKESSWMHYKEKLVLLIMWILEKTLHSNLHVAIVVLSWKQTVPPRIDFVLYLV